MNISTCNNREWCLVAICSKPILVKNNPILWLLLQIMQAWLTRRQIRVNSSTCISSSQRLTNSRNSSTPCNSSHINRRYSNMKDLWKGEMPTIYSSVPWARSPLKMHMLRTATNSLSAMETILDWSEMHWSREAGGSRSSQYTQCLTSNGIPSPMESSLQG